MQNQFTENHAKTFFEFNVYDVEQKCRILRYL